VKFLCDRCKTRYSIGDERVRGKILKIRCKSCANVITVREGMPSPDEVDPAPAEPQGQRRLPRTTTAAPAVQSESLAPAAAPAPGGALGAAFASAMTKPPPALEEEWYVSIDGEQQGPFSRADAQRWIAARPLDAELHCWSEGFDDWLPVDKVSHFRGLRKKPAPAPAPPVAAPPALPRTVTGARGALPRSQPAEEPKPLFAATMAQLEKGPAASELRGRPAATPPNGQLPMGRPAHANGALAQKARAGLASPIAAPLQPRVTTQPGVSAKAPPPAFDSSELADASSTQLDALPLDAAAVDAADAAATTPRLQALDRAIAAAAPAPVPADPGDGDDDLDIGEVSRVVKLADLAPPAASPIPIPRAATQPPVAAAAVRAAAAARLDAARPGELAPAPFAGYPAGAAPMFPGPPMAAPPPVAVSHRRALIALIAGAIVLVGVAVAVVFFVLADQESGDSRLGTVEEIDTTRPEEVRPTGSGAGGTVAQNPDTPANPFVPRPRRTGITQPVTPPTTPEVPAGGNRLEAREIEEMAGKNSSVTQRCYMRAQRGADGILVGDVRKISVTLTISGDGHVTDAKLSDNHAQNTLGRCLITAIKSWRFRTSPGGTFRFVLHFG
jgi:predicted Zn finger-like uncharacterized protein